MSFGKKVKRTAIAGRLVEEKLYEQVLVELESGVLRPEVAVRSKCIACSNLTWLD
jgi:hypothetical protein